MAAVARANNIEVKAKAEEMLAATSRKRKTGTVEMENQRRAQKILRREQALQKIVPDVEFVPLREMRKRKLRQEVPIG
jgi:hypothetical protein